MAQIRIQKGKTRTTYRAIVRTHGNQVCQTFARLGEARAWADVVEQEIRAMVFQDPRGVKHTVSRGMERYLAEVSAQKATTTRTRETTSAKAIVAHLGDIRLTELSAAQVARYRDQRLKKTSATTARLEMALLSDLFRVARREWGLPVTNPVAEVKRPTPAAGRTVFLNDDQARTLLAACRHSSMPTLYAYILTLMHTGMRPSEAAGLRWRQVDMGRQCIILEDTKTAPRRRVPFTTSVAAELTGLWGGGKDREELVYLDARRWQRHTASGRPALAFHPAWKTARRRAGIPHVHLHDLRHTAASHLLMAGVDLRTLADILGHRSLQMVQRYTHLLDGYKLAAVERISGLGV